MSSIKLGLVFLLCIFLSIVFLAIVQMLIGIGLDANGIIVMSVFTCMYFHVKKYKRKLTTREIVRSALVMSLVFNLLSSVVSLSNGNIVSLAELDFFLILIYSFGILAYTWMTSFLYSKEYTRYKCPECDNQFNRKELKKLKYCPTCDIMAIESK